MAKPRGWCRRYPGKIPYESRPEAATALLKAKKMHDKGLPPPRTYKRCRKSEDPDACKLWHLTSWTQAEYEAYMATKRERARKEVMV